MDVIVHFTCRDMNRVGMESRALQLAMMGMKNILALTGDFSGKGFGGQGAPVFDLDSVNLQIMLMLMGKRMAAAGDPDGFFYRLRRFPVQADGRGMRRPICKNEPESGRRCPVHHYPVGVRCPQVP